MLFVIMAAEMRWSVLDADLISLHAVANPGRLHRAQAAKALQSADPLSGLRQLQGLVMHHSEHVFEKHPEMVP